MLKSMLKPMLKTEINVENAEVNVESFLGHANQQSPSPSPRLALR